MWLYSFPRGSREDGGAGGGGRGAPVLQLEGAGGGGRSAPVLQLEGAGGGVCLPRGLLTANC